MKVAILGLGLWVALVMVSSAQADIMPIGEASTATFTQGSFAGETARGWDFIVNSSGVSVTQLGVAAATSGDITMTLWDEVAKTVLAQISVTSVANAWAFGALGAPVSLLQGHTYSVIGWQNATTPWYLFNNSAPAQFTPTGTIQYLNGRFGNDADANTFPMGSLGSPAQYGVTDIAYIAHKETVPEPSTLALFGAGIGALGLFCWRSRKKVASLATA